MFPKHWWLLAAASLAAPASAAPFVPSPVLVAETVELLGKSVALNTAPGEGKTGAYAALIAAKLQAAGFAAADVTITPVGDTAILTARYRGTGKKRPMVLTGHMDVVPADPKDWTRDPFTMIEDGGYFFGRGVEDNKFDVTMLVASLINLKREGFKPARDIYLMLSGDEENAGTTAPLQAQIAKDANAEFMLNGDAGGGEIGEDGKVISYSIQGAEKAYADYTVTYLSPGGHSSQPRPDNAINNLARAALAVASYAFPVMSNAWTLGTFAASGVKTPAPMGPAMLAFAAKPGDMAAAAVISADPLVVGQVRTTCISTQIKGGHATNALPQRASLNINCRIFPGTTIESVRLKLVELIADPHAEIVTGEGFVASDASPMRADIVAAVTSAVQQRYPGLAVVPGMSSGATDSVFYRAIGIPSYGVSGLFTKASDSFAHGLNERVPVVAVPGALQQWHSVITQLAK